MTQTLNSTPIIATIPLDDQMASQETEARNSEQGTAQMDVVSISHDRPELTFDLKYACLSPNSPFADQEPRSRISSELKHCILGDKGIFPGYRNCLPIIFSNIWERRRPIPFGQVEDAVQNTFVTSAECWVVHQQPEPVASPRDDIVLVENVWLPSAEKEDLIDLQKKSFDWTLSFTNDFRSLARFIYLEEPITDQYDIEDGDASDGEDEDRGGITCSSDDSSIDNDVCAIGTEGSACDLSPTLVTTSCPTRSRTLHNLVISFVCLVSFGFAFRIFLSPYARAVLYERRQLNDHDSL